MIAERDLGSSLLFFALFVVMLWVATERCALPRARRRCSSRSARIVVVDAVRARARPRRDLAQPVGRPQRARASRSCRRSSRSRGAASPERASASAIPTRIPAVETDFIFAAIGEELGLLGGAAILAAYVLMVGVGLRIARVAERPFEKLLATGLTTIIGVQAFIIIGGVTRVVPLTGVTLPFVSYGGSSLVANYVLLALLMRISDEHARTSRRGHASQAVEAEANSDGCRMNKQIRRLGVGLIVCYVLLFVQLNCCRWCGPTRTTPTRSTPARSSATSASHAGSSRPPTA